MSILKEIIKLKIIFFFLLILISFYRSPYIFLNGRFIGEEANHHFLFALNNNFFTNLIYYIEFAGYYNFIPNFFTWIATLCTIRKCSIGYSLWIFFYNIIITVLNFI